jgi:hypothetical protein
MAAPVNFDDARAVADAVLFEGYLLYPYRSSATKNQMRWQFGVLVPPGADTGDESEQRTEMLLEAGAGAVLHVCVRFLRLTTRDDRHAGLEGVDRGWDEGEPVERVVDVPVARVLAGVVVEEISLEADRQTAGGATFTSLPVRAEARLSAEQLPGPYGVIRLRVRIRNTGARASATDVRAVVVRRSLIGTHALLGVEGGRFVSSIDPPEWARPFVDGCRNQGAYPVLVGPGESMVLASPIILSDHPEVAPESAGPLFDATEIDEILVLRTLTLGDDEKAEARATDPRAAELIDRVEDLPPEVLERLHGAIRSMRTVDASPTVEVEGVRVGRGSRVRLRPRRNADAQDMFWAGRAAVVAEVLCDVDGNEHVAVIAEDDPGADVRDWQGRYLYFAPTELEPLAPATEGA